jgi:hypothetical protein
LSGEPVERSADPPAHRQQTTVILGSTDGTIRRDHGDRWFSEDAFDVVRRDL